MPNHTKITVLESRWWGNSNVSVRGTFDLVSDLHCGTHHGYNYEMCNSRAALTEALTRYVHRDENTNYISIAAHGNSEGLALYNDDIVSRSVLRNTLKRDKARNLCGLHLGACFFGTRELVRFLYQDDISAWWIAGYSKEVDFIESTILDCLFFKKLLEFSRSEPLNQIIKTCGDLEYLAAGLIEKLQFGVYFWDTERRKVVNFFSEADFEEFGS